jgi:AmmeMemoRadiSam system protein A
MTEKLTESERELLLRLARTTLESAVRGEKLPPLELSRLPPALRTAGASFVTLTIHGQLRGCIGALEPYQPLAADVREHAVAAALEDTRFPPVSPAELPRLLIEISRLTPPQALPYTDAQDLLSRLCPGIDGVILRDGSRRGTFLPQVWEQLPDKAEFLSRLCQKMGAQSSAWRSKHLEVQIYQVEEFHESR